MAGRYEKAARQEIDHQGAYLRWRDECVSIIHAHVSAADVLQQNGVKLRYGGKRAESIFCPFHDNTKTMAARFHPADARNPDHMWCFGACNFKRPWDAITLFGKFSGYAGKFTGLLWLIAKEYSLTLPERPENVPDNEPDGRELEEVFTNLDKCERTLKGARQAFDMKGYLILGSILDRITYGLDTGTLPLPKAKDTIQKVFDKIREKESKCPGG